MVSMEVQCSPARPAQMVERAVQVKAPAVRHASVSASVSTANASTCHYLVVDVGLQHSSSQTEMPEQPEPEQPPPAAPEPERRDARRSPIEEQRAKPTQIVLDARNERHLIEHADELVQRNFFPAPPHRSIHSLCGLRAQPESC